MHSRVSKKSDTASWYQNDIGHSKYIYCIDMSAYDIQQFISYTTGHKKTFPMHRQGFYDSSAVIEIIHLFFISGICIHIGSGSFHSALTIDHTGILHSSC